MEKTLEPLRDQLEDTEQQIIDMVSVNCRTQQLIVEGNRGGGGSKDLTCWSYAVASRPLQWAG